MKLSCSDCRFRIGADPGRLDTDTQGHIQECAECQRYCEEIRRLDDGLLRALQLESREHQTSATASPRPPIRRPHAIAAAVAVLGVSAALLYLQRGDFPLRSPQPLQQGEALSTNTLASKIAAHIAGEPTALVNRSAAADPREIRRILGAAGLALDAGERTTIHYIMRCEFDGQQIVHMVLEGANGPVTVLWLQKDYRMHRPRRFRIARYEGVITPFARGAVAVISAPGDADAESRRVLQAIRYRTG